MMQSVFVAKNEFTYQWSFQKKIKYIKIRTHSVLLSVTNLLKNTLGFLFLAKLDKQRQDFAKFVGIKKLQYTVCIVKLKKITKDE